MTGKRPTILDVARRAGVSKSTVSLVLQQSPLVRAETRARVSAAMADIGYVYNRSAANLRGSGAGLIGLVINDLRNPFFTEFAASAQMAFAREGYATVVANTDEDPALQTRVIASMIEHDVAALIISPTYGGGSDVFAPIERAGAPAMQVLRQVDPRTEIFPFSSPDFTSGVALAARHLLGQACRAIVFVGGVEGRPITLERMQGYAEVMRQEGREPMLFPGPPSRAFGREIAQRLAREHPEIDAAICFSDRVALGMLAGFAEIGVAVGTDFRLVGIDDIEECALSFPELSSVRCDIAGFGEETAQTMVQWLKTGRRPPDTWRTEVSLIARRSSLGPMAAAATG